MATMTWERAKKIAEEITKDDSVMSYEIAGKILDVYFEGSVDGVKRMSEGLGVK